MYQEKYNLFEQNQGVPADGGLAPADATHRRVPAAAPATAPAYAVPDSRDRYARTFASLAEGELAFVPFFMLGDPDRETSMELIRAAIAAGADALEVGIGFSDPVADGPTVQNAHLRALAAGPTLAPALEQIAQIRAEAPDLPIGILTYANMAFGCGLEEFCVKLAAAGADSVLVADCPLRERTELESACENVGLAPIFIAPPDADEHTIHQLATLTKGYIYVVSRPGVTGTAPSPATTLPADGVSDASNAVPSQALPASVPVPSQLDKTVAKLRERCQIPLMQGFGIKNAQQVHEAKERGVDGVICGSALLELLETYLDDRGRCDTPSATKAIAEKISRLKAATRP